MDAVLALNIVMRLLCVAAYALAARRLFALATGEADLRPPDMWRVCWEVLTGRLPTDRTHTQAWMVRIGLLVAIGGVALNLSAIGLRLMHVVEQPIWKALLWQSHHLLVAFGVMISASLVSDCRGKTCLTLREAPRPFTIGAIWEARDE